MSDVIDVLLAQRNWHTDQIRRINLAIDILRGEASEDFRIRPEWSKTIDAMFEQFPGPWNLDDVRSRLAEMGIAEALEDKHRNTVYATLYRKVQAGTVRYGNGMYWRPLPEPDQDQDAEQIEAQA